MSTVSFRERCLNGLESNLRRLCKQDEKWNQFMDEQSHQWEEQGRLGKEKKELETTLTKTLTEDDRKRKQQDLEIVTAKGNIELSKYRVAFNQRHQRQYELKKSLLDDGDPQLAVIDAKIKEYQGGVRVNEEEVNQYQTKLDKLMSEKNKDEGRSESLQEGTEKDEGKDIEDLSRAESSGTEHHIPESNEPENKVSQDKEDADKIQGIIEETNEGDEGGSDNTRDLETSETTSQDEQTESLASPLAVTEAVVVESNKDYVRSEDNVGVSDSRSGLVNTEDKENVTEVPPTIVRRISPWWFLSLLPVGGFVAVGLVWFLRRWRK